MNLVVAILDVNTPGEGREGEGRWEGRGRGDPGAVLFFRLVFPLSSYSAAGESAEKYGREHCGERKGKGRDGKGRSRRSGIEKREGGRRMVERGGRLPRSSSLLQASWSCE